MTDTIKQKKLIHENDWDTLVVLDACRYDIFRDIYQNFLDGDLKSVITGVDNTGAWLQKTFPDYYDLTYVSGMPHINSWGFSLAETNNEWEWNWTSEKHFKKIVDVWDFGFDKSVGTVRPEAVTESALQVTDGKMILHYAQPHFPSLLMERKREGENKFRKGNPNLIRKKIAGLIRLVFGKKILFRLRKLIGKTNGNGIAECFLSNEGIEYYYRKNIEYALKSFSRYAKKQNGETIIVTADHGEYLGENGHFGHKEMTVPWLRVVK